MSKAKGHEEFIEEHASAYCLDCDHPHGYHDKERGCTMPLSNGVPVTRRVMQDSTCRCGETDAYKADRLSRVVEVKHAHYLAAQREYTAHVAAMLDKTEES